MEESGISRAVVMGRKADEYGEVTMRTSLSWPAPIHRLLFLLPGSTLTMRICRIASMPWPGRASGACASTVAGGGPSPATVKREGNAGSKTAE